MKKVIGFIFLLFIVVIGTSLGTLFLDSRNGIYEKCEDSGIGIKGALFGLEEASYHGDDYYYNQLDDNTKDIYKRLMDAYDEKRKTIAFTLYDGFDEMDITKTIIALRNDHPDIYEVSPHESYSYQTIDALNLGFIVLPDIESPITIEEINNEVEDIVSMINPGDDTSRIKQLNDIICINYSYDLESAYSGDIRNMVYENRGVCQGYAQLFKLCMDKMGYECIIVLGNAYANEELSRHAWNAVKLSDGWYMIDPTWADQELYSYINYDFFLKRYADFDRHYPDDTFDYDFIVEVME